MYFMSTGTNGAGIAINGAQKIKGWRRCASIRSAVPTFWFDDERLDTIENGQLAGLVVLNDDPLTVSNDRFRLLSSMLTLQGGRIVAGTVW